MANTTNFGWETPDDTDLVKDGAAAMRTLGNAIDTSLVDLKGGTTGQVLSKTSNTDMDFTWVTSDDANAIQNAIVDAKGDLISATAADTPARLAVGNNGETLVADSSQTTGLRYNPILAISNPVINGGFDIWQRGTSSTANSFAGGAGYSADRWQSYSSGNTITTSRQATGDTTNLPTIQYCARLQRNSGQTSTSTVNMFHSIETANSIPFIGKAITVTFWARAGANYSSASNALTAAVYTGTGTDQVLNSFTGLATTVSSNVTLTTTWQRFAITGTPASTATEIGLAFFYTPSGTAGANDYVELTGVQIDIGTYSDSSAPQFRRSGNTLAGELAACQRYYYRTSSTNAYGAVSVSGYTTSTTNANILVNLPVAMRVVPTALDFSTLQIGDVTNTYYTVSAMALNVSTTTTIAACDTTSTGMTASRWAYLRANNSTSAYLGFSAEL